MLLFAVLNSLGSFSRDKVTLPRLPTGTAENSVGRLDSPMLAGKVVSTEGRGSWDNHI